MKKKLILKKGVLLIFILLMHFQSGCVTVKYKYQAYLDLKDLVLDEYNRIGSFFLFFETKNKNTIAYNTIHDLHSFLYRSSNLNDSYFKDIMMGKIILTCEDLEDCFTLVSVIMDEYKKKGIKEFLKKYATCDEKYNIYTINPFLSQDEQLSIAYCFYLNNIYTAQDCYSFEYNSCKKDLLRGIPVDDFEWEGLIN